MRIISPPWSTGKIIELCGAGATVFNSRWTSRVVMRVPEQDINERVDQRKPINKYRLNSLEVEQ